MGYITRVVCCIALFCGVLAAPAAAKTSLAAPPPGANDWSCKPSAAHPEPVVLVHGLGATMFANWAYMSPQLKARGYCVFALTYGQDPRLPAFGGTIPVQDSAKELDVFVSRVLSATGASKVDLVGHSEGTFMPQYWLKKLGGAAKTDDYVALTPLYDGTQLLALDYLRDTFGPLGGLAIGLVNQVCGSCTQFLRGSDMQKQLAAGGKAAPGVRYTTIMTKYDELVIPYTSGVIDGVGNKNIVVQDVCKNDISEHGAVAFDPVVARLIFNALDPANAKEVSCAGLPPLAPPAVG